MKTEKITLTPGQLKWLEEHFKHTRNAEAARRLGISETSLHRFARRLGLKKTPQFMRKCQRATADAAKASHLRNGTYPPKGYIIPGSENNRFRKGETSLQRIGKRKERIRVEKSAASRRQILKEERARALFGIPRKTRLNVVRRPRYIACQRYYLRKLGYLIDRGSFVAYYTPETRRSPSFEARTRGNCPRYVHFDFLPYETKNTDCNA